MTDTTLHKTLINRMEISMLQKYCEMKNIKIHKILHNNHGELKPYEAKFGRELTRKDAIIISPLTQHELNEIICQYNDDEEFQAWRKKEYEERIKEFQLHPDA